MDGVPQGFDISSPVIPAFYSVTNTSPLLSLFFQCSSVVTFSLRRCSELRMWRSLLGSATFSVLLSVQKCQRERWRGCGGASPPPCVTTTVCHAEKFKSKLNWWAQERNSSCIFSLKNIKKQTKHKNTPTTKTNAWKGDVRRMEEAAQYSASLRRWRRGNRLQQRWRFLLWCVIPNRVD